MDPKKLLAEKQAEAQLLGKKANEDPANFTQADVERAETLVTEIGELVDQIERTDGVAKALAGLPSLKQAAGTSQDNDGQEEDLTQKAGMTPGQQFVNSPALKAFRAAHPKGVRKGEIIDLKVGMVAKADPAPLNSVTPGQARAVRQGGIEDMVYRPERTLLDVITRGSTDLAWFQYRQIVSKTNNASIVPEARTTTGTTVAQGLKPLSTLTTALAEAREYTYADGMEVTNKELEDDGVIRGVIDGELRENLEIEKENVLLNGAGTADEPAGILHTTGVLQQAFVTDVPTSIRKAITKLRTTSGAQIRGVLLNPEDDETWDLLKDTHGDWIAGPWQMGPRTAWGYERISAQSIPVGQAIIGDFSTVHLLQYSPLEILAFNQHKDYAQKNLTYIRAEERALQLIRNAAKLCIVDLTPGA